MKADYFIVGGGLAGSLLAWFLDKAGSSFLLFDEGREQTCSKLAAGIVNPVTGKRLVKSWRFDEFFDFAATTYAEMEKAWGVSLFHPFRIFRALRQMELRNQWAFRLSDPAYCALLQPEQPHFFDASVFAERQAYGCISKAARLDLPLLLSMTRKAFAERHVREKFDHQKLEVGEAGVRYKGHTAKAVVFCEGYAVKRNPWFADLPLRPAKGHVLHLQLASALHAEQSMYKDELYFVPLTREITWCGSDYIWDFEDEQPEPAAVRALEEKAVRILKKPYRILSVHAAVRPTVKDRRPLLGRHPEYSPLYVFNGLGTKGSSLGPYFAAQMAAHLLDGRELDAEVDIRRFDGVAVERPQ